jgi:flavin-dependent dehydrogenase
VPNTKFVLIGSGLAGGLLGAYLGRRGYDVDLYERRADPREGNIVGGRSINLLTCSLFFRFRRPRSFATTKTDADLRQFFQEEFSAIFQPRGF